MLPCPTGAQPSTSLEKSAINGVLLRFSGGEGGIRTHGSPFAMYSWEIRHWLKKQNIRAYPAIPQARRFNADREPLRARRSNTHILVRSWNSESLQRESRNADRNPWAWVASWEVSEPSTCRAGSEASSLNWAESRAVPVGLGPHGSASQTHNQPLRLLPKWEPERCAVAQSGTSLISCWAARTLLWKSDNPPIHVILVS